MQVQLLGERLVPGWPALGGDPGWITLADLALDEETVETYIRDIIVHVGEPGTPGD